MSSWERVLLRAGFNAVVASLFIALLAAFLFYAQERVVVDMDAVEIMARHGFNCFRPRLFVNSPYSDVVVNELPTL